MKKCAAPVINQEEYQHRRQLLLAQCQQNSLCVIPAASMVTRSNDTEYSFRQDSDFWYLTGFNEPDAYLLLSNADELSGNSASGASVIFVQPTDAHAEVWHGRRLGVDRAAAELGVDVAHSSEDIEPVLHDLIDGHDHVYFAMGARETVDTMIADAIEMCRTAPKQSKHAPNSLHDIRPAIHEMRLIKSNAEIEIMQHAANISCDAHIRAMKYAHVSCNEFELEAEIKHEFAMQGARDEAYHSIVGAGENACILHYTENNQTINDGDLVLIDAGCESQCYASDITRTFPVNGKFSDPQAKLYQLVLDAQLAALDVFKPGATISQAMHVTVQVLVEGLVSLGILKGSVTSNIDNETWKTFFMHGLGHWLGIDVHDVGIYKINGQDRPLQAGMVLTVEPGLYIPSTANVDDQFKGIGIRIEDDIVITESGYKVMTTKVPKTIADIEALMAT